MTQPTFLKNFLDWFTIKPKLDKSNHQPPLVEEGNIWWCKIGENIGTEISGKGREYTRPVIIYKKLSKFTFLVIPLSTKTKTGSWFVEFTHDKVKMVACLHQIRVVDYRRINDKIGKMDSTDMSKIKSGLGMLYNF